MWIAFSLRKPKPTDFISKEFSMWKLEHKFRNGIFIRPKLYGYTDVNNNNLIIKSSGIDSRLISYNDLITLVSTGKINVRDIRFNLDWKNLTIEIRNQNITLTGFLFLYKKNITVFDKRFKLIKRPNFNIIIYRKFNMSLMIRPK